MVSWRPTRPSRTNNKKDILFIIGDWNVKVGSNRQICPWSTKWSTKDDRVFPRECTGHSKHPLPKTQDSTRGHHQMVNTRNQIDYVLSSQRWRSSIQSAKTRLGADCGSDHEFLIAKFRLKLQKVGKTTRPFRYDLNQISYDYPVEVRNRFKGLDLIDTVPEELWTEVHDIVQEAVIKTIPRKKKCKKGKMVVWGGLTNTWEKKRS